MTHIDALRPHLPHCKARFGVDLAAAPKENPIPAPND